MTARAFVRCLAAGCVASWLAGCAGQPAPAPAQPLIFTHTISAALATGDPDLAESTLRSARLSYPDDGGLLLWSAVLEQMRWRDVMALNDLQQLRRSKDRGGLDEAKLMGWIGDLLFRTGSYAESIPFLYSGQTGDDGERRRAMSILVRDLPYNRQQPKQLFAELPLLEGPLPELLCTIGQKQRPFALDTGASFTTLTRSLAKDLGVAPIIGGGSAQDGAGRSFEVSFGVLPSLSLGTVQLEAQPVLVVDDERLALRDSFGGPPRPPAGVVGLDILARFRVTFDPKRQSVVFELPRGLDPDDSVACVHYDGRCLVPVVIEGQDLWFVLDTGASHSSLTDRGLDALPGGARRANEALRRVRTPGGTQFAVRQVQGLGLAVGSLRFAGVDLAVVARPGRGDFPVHGVLGSDLIMRCRTTFDLGRLRMEALPGG